mgnify:CR=1 FL=1
MTASRQIRTAIVGLGNCASSLVQGISYCRALGDEAIGVLFTAHRSSRHWRGGDVTLPPLMEESFWTQALVLFLGYLVIIGIFYFLKSLLFRKAAH